MQVKYARDAEKFLSKLKKSNPKIAGKIVGKIEELADAPISPADKKLRGYEKEYLRLRIGDYRVIYFAEDNAVKIAVIGLRNDGVAYRKFKRISDS